MTFTPRLIFVTASTVEEARTIAHDLLDAHLAACIQIIPGIETHYWWQGKIENCTEALILIKSSAEQFGTVRDFIQLRHSYHCPEIVAVSPEEISPAYRSWWEQSLTKL